MPAANTASSGSIRFQRTKFTATCSFWRITARSICPSAFRAVPIITGNYHFLEKLISLMIADALNDKPFRFMAREDQCARLVYMEGHCSAIDLTVRKGREGEIYNIGGHNERTNLQVVKAILNQLGKPESLITFVTDRRYVIDAAKIHRGLGWEPTTHFEDGIKRTVKWYLENRPWWEHIIMKTALMDKNRKTREC